MFRIFRRIREEVLLGKVTHRYLGYAVGELILVVLGILIALQINNWNEERIEQQQIAEYAHALIEDLQRDLEMAQIIRIEIDLLISKIDALAAYIEDRPLEAFRNIDLFYLMRTPFYRPYSWSRTALEQIKSSGSLRQMTNRQLAEKISAYEAFTYHLEGDFDSDRTIGNKSIELAGTVIDMNYPGVFQNFPVGQLEYFSFPNSPIHDVYKDTNLSLLTDDLKDIKVVVNSYLVLGSYYGIRPRAEIEMPKLVADAQELIAMLKDEYPE